MLEELKQIERELRKALSETRGIEGSQRYDPEPYIKKALDKVTALIRQLEE